MAVAFLIVSKFLWLTPLLIVSKFNFVEDFAVLCLWRFNGFAVSMFKVVLNVQSSMVSVETQNFASVQYLYVCLIKEFKRYLRCLLFVFVGLQGVAWAFSLRSCETVRL